ncbi:hypothetical protein [Streptomyces nodosus]|uniref:hypothetical protein n=1 Tax=Streptomyces nodosus TaxID=40318 RepID=UPI003809E97B
MAAEAEDTSADGENQTPSGGRSADETSPPDAVSQRDEANASASGSIRAADTYGTPPDGRTDVDRAAAEESRGLRARLFPMGLAVLGAIAVAMFTPLGTEITSWVSDLTGWGKPEGSVAVAPLLHPCEQKWAMPPAKRNEAAAAYAREKDGLWKDDAGLISWLKTHEAIALNSSTIDVDVSTDARDKAVLHDVRVRVTRREPAPELAALQPSCGGPGYYYSFGVPLHELPVGRTVSVREMYERWRDEVVLPEEETGQGARANSDTESARPLTLPMTMSVEDPASLRIKAFTKEDLCEWEIELVWTMAGEDERHTETVDFDGDPFKTVAQPDRDG